MKTLVAVIAVVALAAGSYAVQQEDRPGKKHQDAQGIQVFKASQAEWKQADKMPQGVMKALVCESKSGGSVWLMKFPAGTRVPAHMAPIDKVIHVHEGSLEIGQGAAAGQPGRGAQDQPGRGGEGQSGQGQTVSAGDIVKISANTSYWLQAKTETLALVAMDAKGDASGQRSSEDPENKVK